MDCQAELSHRERQWRGALVLSGNNKFSYSNYRLGIGVASILFSGRPKFALKCACGKQDTRFRLVKLEGAIPVKGLTQNKLLPFLLT